MITNRKTSLGCSWRVTRAFTMVLSIVVFALAFSAGSAWSLDNTLRMNDPANYHVLHGKGRPTSKSSPSSVAEACLPLLQSHNILPVSATDDRRSAGKAKIAALGLVIGAQFALAPTATPTPGYKAVPSKATNTSNEPDRTGNPNVLAVSAYRNCVKQKALKELSSLRWER